MNPSLGEKLANSIYTDEKFPEKYREIRDALQRHDQEKLRLYVNQPVNLTEDPLLNVLIAYKKSALVIELLEDISFADLLKDNYVSDTALHVAAMVGDVEVAKALIKKNGEFLYSFKKKWESIKKKWESQSVEAGDPFGALDIGWESQFVSSEGLLGALDNRWLSQLAEADGLIGGRDNWWVSHLIYAGGLLGARNKQLESPLHKAALCGKSNIFWLLQENGGDCSARKSDGSTVLHCAITGNAPRLALEIAKEFPDLMMTRNMQAATPLQVTVTIPDAFHSRSLLGPIDGLIYNCIPLDDSSPAHDTHKDDIENPGTKENLDESTQPVGVIDSSQGLQFPMKYGRKFPPNYATLFDLLFVAYIPAKCIWLLLYRILKQSFARVESLEQRRRNHREAMKLVRYLARDPKYWDFSNKGAAKGASLLAEPPTSDSDSPSIMMQPPHEPEGSKANEKKEFGRRWAESPLTLGAKMGLHKFLEEILKVCQQSANYLDVDSVRRWDESPLTLCAKMGLHELVKEILEVCPQSAKYLDEDGRNILQVAIQHGQKEIVDTVESMLEGANPVLPSWLLSSIDEKTENAILHFAAEKTTKEEAGPLQMQMELQWFERVKKLVPEGLEYSRNKTQQTAQELFTENHKDMVKDAKNQLREMGKTCSGLLAAVVFASSFSSPEVHNGVAFMVYSHAYVIGLSFASTALVLFFSLLTCPCREKDFRRSLLTQYFLANLSFFLALVALLVAFACNVYLTIYGDKKAQSSGLVPLICELTIFPAACCLVLLYRGSNFGLINTLRHVWR